MSKCCMAPAEMPTNASREKKPMISRTPELTHLSPLERRTEGKRHQGRTKELSWRTTPPPPLPSQFSCPHSTSRSPVIVARARHHDSIVRMNAPHGLPPPSTDSGRGTAPP